jgi:hypothetical protein
VSKKGMVRKALVLAGLVGVCASGLQAAALQFEQVARPAASSGTDERRLDPRLLAAGALCVVVAIARRRRMD